MARILVNFEVIAALSFLTHSATPILIHSKQLLSLLPSLNSNLAGIVVSSEALPSLLSSLPNGGRNTTIIVSGPGQVTLETQSKKIITFDSLTSQSLNTILHENQEKVTEELNPESTFLKTYVNLDATAKPIQIELSHQNFTAAVHALIHFAPARERLSNQNVIFSFMDPLTPLGLAIALTSTHTESQLFLPPTRYNNGVDIVTYCRAHANCTHMFMSPAQANSLASILEIAAIQNITEDIYVRALTAKIWYARQGDLGRHLIWDRSVFDVNKREMGLENLKELVVFCKEGEGLTQKILDALRSNLSIPVVVAYYHTISPVPILHRHPYDLQFFKFKDVDTANHHVHFGTGSVNLESKLILSQDSKDEGSNEAHYTGQLVVRGPGIPTKMEDKGSEKLFHYDGREENELPWLRVSPVSQILPNGTVKILPGQSSQ